MRSIATDVMNATGRFNIREGLRPDGDRLPICVHQEGINLDKRISEKEMDTLIEDYC
jgi:hypothetical protein